MMTIQSTNFPLRDTSHDLPGLITTNEIRYCQYCKADTPHRVGVHKEFVDRPTYTQDKETEYAHCQCGNTATETIKKVTVMKVQS